MLDLQVDTDSIGSVICKKAEELHAVLVAMAVHTKTRLQEFFMGSVTNYVLHHCKRPLVIVH